jgi:hypothetical protein
VGKSLRYGDEDDILLGREPGLREKSHHGERTDFPIVTAVSGRHGEGVIDMLYTQGNNSGLQKLSIACKTCNVSESYYSTMSVKRFRLEHIDHEVVEGSPAAWQRIEPPDGTHDGENVRLLKVLVELVMLPTYKSPVFTITGVKDDLKNAFVQVVSPSQRDQVRETLEKGKYLDTGSGDTVYVWEPKSISFSEDANLAMRFGPSSSVAPDTVDHDPASEESTRNKVPSPPADIQEVQVATFGGERSAVAMGEIAAPQPDASVLLALQSPASPAALSPPSDSLDKPEESVQFPEEVKAAPASAGLGAEPVVSLEPLTAPMEVSMPEARVEVKPILSQGADQAKPEDEGGYLLVSKSWYIEKGPKNMSEALRISKILRPFRWRIEPAYTISVVVDDILSIETANGEIGGDMTKQIEASGYRLSRVSVEKGRPVAWFKRETGPL